MATNNEHDSYLRQWRRLTHHSEKSNGTAFARVRRFGVCLSLAKRTRHFAEQGFCISVHIESGTPPFLALPSLPPFLLSLPSVSPSHLPPSLLSLSPDLSIACSVTLTLWTATPKTEGTPSAQVASQLIQHRCNVNMLRTCHMQHQVCCAIAAQVFSFRLFLESAVALVF